MLRPLLYVFGTLLVTQAAVIATSVYLHRGLAHRALNLHPFADWVFRFVLWFTTGQNRREWVAVHRKHHAFTDTERDPHSPLVHGFWKIQLWNVYYYVREARNPETLARWAKDIRDDVWDRVLFNKGTLGGVVGIAAAMLVLGPGWGLLLAGTSATTRPPTCACSRGSPAARACTTITTRIPRAPSSAWAGSSSIRRGW